MPFTGQKRLVIPVVLAAAAALLFYLFSPPDTSEPERVSYVDGRALKLPRIERKAGRADYFIRMLRDPATGMIPKNVRMRELVHARTLPIRALSKAASGVLSWTEAGPTDVGGRSRALAVDVRDPDVVLAGGASGGMWKSVDGGETWTLKSDASHQFDVTWVAQDRREGHRDTWYYVSGEYEGSAGGFRGSARYFGSGIFKSTDGGDSWEQIQTAGSPVDADTEFDFVSKVVVSPVTGTVFLASNDYGILRSDDGGDTFELVLGRRDDHAWSDVEVGSDGRLLAVVMPGFTPDPETEPGVYVSSDDGVTWTPFPMPAFTDLPVRGVVALAPSNPDVGYLLTQTDPAGYYRLDLAQETVEDRSANMPAFDERDGALNFQGGYNMVMAVKPDDEDFVFIGATSLFRSRDGFATPADDRFENWIGGYNSDPDGPLEYPNHHADQHVIVFDPEDPNRMWTGHDGGISLLEDVTTTESTVPWIDRNNGYNVTQFYTVALHREAGDARLVGGTQDNGSPFFLFNGSEATPSVDASSGDGAFAYLGDEYAYVSAQEGAVQRVPYEADGRLVDDPARKAVVMPNGLEFSPLFVNPFAVDPNDEDVMFYPELDRLWRNTSLSSIPDGAEGTSVGWERLDEIAPSEDYVISALAVSQQPAHRLYFGASPDERTDPPVIMRLDDARTSTDAVDISIPDAAAGSYVHDLAVHPEDADEFLVVFSNYGVPSIFHTADGGQTYTSVEGNLAGDAGDGPSVRSATILPMEDQTLYLVATSTGVYSTNVLSGDDTVWEHEAPGTIGHAVVASIRSRTSDGLVAAGTHGRGIFVGQMLAGNLAPTAHFTVEPSREDPMTFTFDGSSSRDPNGDALAYEWDFGDGAASSGAVVTHTYEEPDTYEVVLRVQDPEGLSHEKSLSVEVTGALAETVRGFDPNRGVALDAYDMALPFDSGFVYGPNFTGLEAFGSQLEVPEYAENGRVSRVRAMFFFKRDGFADETYAFRIYDGDAEGGPTGEPLYEAAVRYADINADENYNELNGWTEYAVDPPVEVGPIFFAVLDFGEATAEKWGSVGLAQGEGGMPVWVGDAFGFYNYSECCEGPALVMDATVLYGASASDPVDTQAEPAEVPVAFALEQNYPNPFNPSTTIEYSLPEASRVRLTVYNVLGREVARVVDALQPAGRHEVRFDAEGLASGLYVYRLEAGRRVAQREMILVK